MGHHKSNQEVEGNPDFGHGRGMPVRPDEEKLEERTVQERKDAGLTSGPTTSSRRAENRRRYEDEVEEVDRQVEQGELRPDANVPRKERPPFPPTRYDQ